ncbi:MAG: type sorting protein, partial [Verrucomicrobiales bacterium]|nr:type sorting protein [Verrucomicrobiales bacterium]
NSFVIFRGDARNGLDPYYLGTDASGHLVFHIENALTNATEVTSPSPLAKDLWHHVAAVFSNEKSILQLYLDGALVSQVASAGVVPFSDLDPSPAASAGVYIGNIPDFGLQFPGYIDELAVYNRALTASEIFGVFKSGSNGKQPGASQFAASRFGIEIPGFQTNLVPTLTWQTNVFYFAGTNSSSIVKFTGAPVSVLLDNIQVTEVNFTTNYYLPEESLLAFKGEQSVGAWSLEVTDNRTGAAVNPSLIGWHLDFIFPTNRASSATLVSNGTSVTNSVVGPETVYYAIDVPGSASYATNTLISAGDLVLIYNNSGLPVGGLADVVVDANGAGGEYLLLSTNSPSTEPISPGQRYYLGVKNANPLASNSFVLTVDFDKTDTYKIITQPLTNGVLFSTNIPPGNQLQYFQYDVTTNAVGASFEVINPSGNVDLVIGRGPFLPNSSTYAYRSANPGTLDEIINVTTNTSPVVLSPGRWYLGVYNFDTNVVTYNIRVTEQPTLSSNIIDLVEGIEQSNVAAPGAYFTNFYKVVITNSPQTVLFELYNMDGNADLVVKREGLPTVGDFDFRSRNFGTNDDRVRVATNSVTTDLNGTWYLGVPNNATSNVNYTVQFVTQTNDIPLLPAGGVDYTNILFNGVATNFTVGPGTVITNLFEFTIDQTNSAALFELYNLTGNVDLIVGQGSFPSTNMMLFSLNAGTSPEQIVIRTNSATTNLNGKWYIAVPNHEEFAVDFTLRGIVSTNGMLISGQSPQFSASSVMVDGSNQFTAQYYGVLGEQYVIEYTTDFVGWNTLTTLITTSVPQTFVDPATVDLNILRFYRLRQIPLP